MGLTKFSDRFTTAMTEDFLQYIWKYRLFKTTDLLTMVGESVVVYQAGLHNTNAGPDFLNARIKIGEETWSGHVEIHVRSSDWKRHHHAENEQYKNVILHVVYENDVDIFLHQPGDLPVLILKDLFYEEQWQRYLNWLESKTWIPCERQIRDVSQLSWIAWKDRLIIERLEQKSGYIHDLLKRTENDWNETFYRIVARNFGFKTNSDGMEMLAESLPQRLLAKHRSDPLQVEALLFGQAGFLEQEFHDEYPRDLKQEYRFLQRKYNLSPMNSSVWKLSRMRPANFPTIRIAQFADLVCKSDHLFSILIENENIAKIVDFLIVDAHPYWSSRYQFDKPIHSELGNSRASLRLGGASIENIMINTIAPMLFSYGQHYSDEKFIERSQKILELCPAESNRIIAEWSKLEIKATNAADSQSLLWLYNAYCDKKRCLNCNIGLELLKKH